MVLKASLKAKVLPWQSVRAGSLLSPALHAVECGMQFQGAGVAAVSSSGAVQKAFPNLDCMWSCALVS